MTNLTAILDKVASELEDLGLKKLAAELDTVSNTMERAAAQRLAEAVLEDPNK